MGLWRLRVLGERNMRSVRRLMMMMMPKLPVGRVKEKREKSIFGKKVELRERGTVEAKCKG